MLLNTFLGFKMITVYLVKTLFIDANMFLKKSAILWKKDLLEPDELPLLPLVLLLSTMAL